MSKKSIHQFLPTISPFDAIGNETLVIQKILRNLGYSSKIYAENIHPDLKNKVYSITEYKNNVNDVIIYHYSIGSKKIVDLLLKSNMKIILLSHNITPSKYFNEVTSELKELLELGLEQLKSLKNSIVYAIADSEFNRLQLEKLGYQKTGVLPILLDKSKYDTNNLHISNDKTTKNILYVGRFAPNKSVEDVIKSFCYYNLNIDANSNLFLVGQVSNNDDPYFESLKNLVKKSELKNIHFIINADDQKLAYYYSISDLFITMSKHEGFCVPLVESMIFKIPIIAKSSTAIPYTLGDQGILIHEETYEEIGELFNLIISNENIRLSIIKNQSKRLQEIYSKTNEDFIINLLKQINELK